ncbi:MAG: DUF3037 domain-containing protein [Muribaculaceae bacterium]|nr:DUF3037 domain-containing protein [Muribaculaceae bacterium]
MAAKDASLYEYAVVRYVPRVDREEFLNIGLLMLCKRRKWMKGEIALDAARLKALYPEVDPEILQLQTALFTRQDVPSPHLSAEERYRWLAAVKSAVIQVSPSHPGLLPSSGKPDATQTLNSNSDLEAEFRRLFSQLVL